MNEKELIDAVNAMCEESLDPETFEKWESVIEVLCQMRRELRASCCWTKLDLGVTMPCENKCKKCECEVEEYYCECKECGHEFLGVPDETLCPECGKDFAEPMQIDEGGW